MPTINQDFGVIFIVLLLLLGILVKLLPEEKPKQKGVLLWR